MKRHNTMVVSEELLLVVVQSKHSVVDAEQQEEAQSIFDKCQCYFFSTNVNVNFFDKYQC